MSTGRRWTERATTGRGTGATGRLEQISVFKQEFQLFQDRIEHQIQSITTQYHKCQLRNTKWYEQ